mgnify:CR=1 FL=1
MTIKALSASERNEAIKRHGLIELQNHKANIDQDHLTICGFFNTDDKFKQHAESLQKNIDDRLVRVQKRLGVYQD